MICRRCEIETEDLIERIRQILEDKKALDLVVLDVRDRSTVTEWIVVASGMSKPHIKALYEDVLVRLKHEGTPCYRHNGEVEGGWVVLDYVHVVVHVFTAEAREYYHIEDLWKEDGPTSRKLEQQDSADTLVEDESEPNSDAAESKPSEKKSGKKQSSRPSSRKVFENVTARVKQSAAKRKNPRKDASS